MFPGYGFGDERPSMAGAEPLYITENLCPALVGRSKMSRLRRTLLSCSAAPVNPVSRHCYTHYIVGRWGHIRPKPLIKRINFPLVRTELGITVRRQFVRIGQLDADGLSGCCGIVRGSVPPCGMMANCPWGMGLASESRAGVLISPMACE